MIWSSLARRGARTAITMVLMLGLIAGCSGGDGGPASGDKDWRTDADRSAVLRVAAHLGAGWKSASFDPVASTAGPDLVFGRLIFGTLTDKNAEGEPVPALVQSWEQPDDTVLALKLREGVTFHDGSPFDAAAVKAGLDRNRAADSPYAQSLDAIESIEATDAGTVTIAMSRPAAGALLLTLSGREGLIPAPASIADPDSMVDVPIGAGPFTVTEWQPGEALSLRAYDKYYDPDQFLLGGIDFSNVTDDASTRNAVLAGNIDLGFVDAEGVKALESNPNTGVAVNPSEAMYYLNLDLDRDNPPLKDVRVRQALSHAVDREQIAASLVGEGSLPVNQLFPEGSVGHDPALDDVYDFDLAKAKQLLEEAGYGDGFTLRLLTTPKGPQARASESVADTFGQIGVDVKISSSNNYIQDYFTDRRTDAAMGWWLPRTDPSLTFLSLFGDVGVLNVSGYENEELNEIAYAAQAQTERDAINEQLVKASKIVSDEALEISIATSPSLWGYSSRVGLRDGKLRDYGNIGSGVDFSSVFVTK